ncbi:MAG TPA: hypothetical protein VM051_09275 [Usitatibacter sp.]|nr:hypothetical protein [Usitatibacter sp.]
MITRLAAMLLAAGAVAAHAAEPVAFVADLQGNATIDGNGKVNFLAELPAGTRLLLGIGSTVAVTYASSGSEFTLQGPGEYLVAATEVKAQRGVAPRKRTVSVLPDAAVIAKASRTANASLRMRGINPQGTSKVALEFPVATRITTLQPTLRWSGEPTADEFTVTVMDSAGKEVWKGSVKPATAKPGVKLAPATVYTWTVMTPQGARADGRFETVSAAAMAKAEKSRAAARTFSERVMHAFVLQEMGATQEAKDAWAALARDRPDLPELGVLAR